MSWLVSNVIRVNARVIGEIAPGEYVTLEEHRAVVKLKDQFEQLVITLQDDITSIKEYNKLRENYIEELKFDIQSLKADLDEATDRLVKITELATRQDEI